MGHNPYTQLGSGRRAVRTNRESTADVYCCDFVVRGDIEPGSKRGLEVLRTLIGDKLCVKAAYCCGDVLKIRASLPDTVNPEDVVRVLSRRLGLNVVPANIYYAQVNSFTPPVEAMHAMDLKERCQTQPRRAEVSQLLSFIRPWQLSCPIARAIAGFRPPTL